MCKIKVKYQLLLPKGTSYSDCRKYAIKPNGSAWELYTIEYDAPGIHRIELSELLKALGTNQVREMIQSIK